MDLFEAVERRASVRQFEPADIPEADIERILDAGRRAPSGKNLQPVSFIVIRSKATIEALARAQGCIGQASAVIALVADPASTYWLEDSSAAAAYMLLAIKALGYDSVWIEGTLSRHEAWAKEVLGVPPGLRLIILLPIGRAAAPVAQKARKPLSEVVHRERW
jgi:nitroreductase